MQSARMRIAIQKSGRLSEDSNALLKGCGVKVHMNTQRLIVMSRNMPIDILRVRDDDIPQMIFDGVVDLGIVGEGVLEEKMLEAQARGEAAAYGLLRKLDFGECRLSLAVPRKDAYEGPESLSGKRVATTFPQLLARFMRQKGVAYKTAYLTGSVEIAPRAGLADAICDQVSTGATLEANGLREVEEVYRSKAVLIRRTSPMHEDNEKLLATLLERIEGMICARESKYIMLHCPVDKIREVSAILPGAEHPTILKLEDDDTRVALHAVSTETLFWETMEKLKALGASSILVLPIEKMLK